VVATTLAASTACLVRRRKLDSTGRAGLPLLTAGLEELAGSLRQRYEALETLTATVDLEPSIISPRKGEIADYKDVRGYILLSRPEWIRVIALYPLLRGTALDMVSDGKTFRLHLPLRNLFLTGENRVDKPSPHKLENLRPQHLLEALIIRPPEAGAEQAVFENWTDGGGASYLMHVLRRDGAGRLLLARRVWFDRSSLEVARQQLFDAAGDPVTDVRYGGWERRDGFSFPRQLRISRPKDEYELSIRFLKTTFNEPLGEDRFQLAPPPGVRVRRVGESSDQPPANGDPLRD